VSACFTKEYVFASYEQGDIIQYQFVNESPIKHELLGHTKKVTDLFIMNDKFLVSGSYDSTIRVWNIETGEAESVYKTSGAVNKVIAGEDN
jgi:WD40 repeat protein